jgi:hypothetical protein
MLGDIEWLHGVPQVLQYLLQKDTKLAILIFSGVLVVLSPTIGRIIILFLLRILITIVVVFIILSAVIP